MPIHFTGYPNTNSRVWDNYPCITSRKINRQETILISWLWEKKEEEKNPALTTPTYSRKANQCLYLHDLCSSNRVVCFHHSTPARKSLYFPFQALLISQDHKSFGCCLTLPPRSFKSSHFRVSCTSQHMLLGA